SGELIIRIPDQKRRPSASSRSAHSGSAGSVRSTPGGMRTRPFSAPNRGCRSPGLAAALGDAGEGEDSPAPGLRTRRNTSLRAFTSTCSVRNPAASHTLVMTLLLGLLLHQAGYCGEFRGSLVPITRSISA